MPPTGVKVDGLARIIGAVSGLTLVAPELDAASTIATGLGILLTCAIVTRILAVQRGRSAGLWFAGGLLTGFVAVTLLLILDRDQG